MDSLFGSCLNPEKTRTLSDKDALISLQEYTHVQPRNSDMGGDGWSLFSWIGASEPESKGKNKGAYVCQEHAMMYQKELKNCELSSDDEDAGDIVPHAEGYVPNVTLNTRRRLLDEFNAVMTRNAGGVAQLIRGISSHRNLGAVDITLVQWINTLLRLIWPRMSKVVQKAVDELVEPAVRQAVPQIKGSFELVTNMGKIPPTLGPMKTFKDENSISLEIGITWDADLDVTVEASVLTILVDQLKLKGTLVVKMCPLIDEIPLVGALHIYFLDPPDLDIRIRIKRSPLKLSNTINREIDKGVRDAVVLPNRILAPVALMHQIPSMAPLHNPPPIGLLKLTVVEMRNLPAADMGFFGKASSDPFAEVRIGAQTWKSGYVSGTLNPVFKKDNVHNFWFFTDHQNVHISVWDFDKASGNDILGDVLELTVDTVGTGERWYDIEPALEFRTKEGNKEGDDKEGGGGCFKSKRRDAADKKVKKEAKENTRRESDVVVDETRGVPQVLLRGSIHRLSGKVKYAKQHLEFILEVSVVGIRKAKGEKTSCDFALCACTFGEDTRWAPACFPNAYADPTFIAKNINPATVHRLAQIHSEEQVAEILDIKTEQVQACQRAGHEGIWCHSFFFQCKKDNGEVEFTVQEAVKGKKFMQKLAFHDLKTDGLMEASFSDFEIGPFYIDVKLKLSAIIPSTLE